jgi:hypothetical protein
VKPLAGRSVKELKQYLFKVQKLMHENGVTALCLNMITLEEEQDMAYEAIKLL